MNEAGYFALAVWVGFFAINAAIRKEIWWFAVFSAFSALDVFLAISNG